MTFSPYFSPWPRSASRPGGPSRQEKAEESSNATVEAFDEAGGPSRRDVHIWKEARGAVPQTGCVESLARCGSHRAARLSCPVGGTAPRRPWPW